MSEQKITCDFDGKPLKITKVTTFTKQLIAKPVVRVSDQVSVIQDPDEIAVTLGIAGEGFQTG